MASKKNLSDRRLRVGFVGAGGIAPEHAAALHLLGNVNLAAVCDLREDLTKVLAAAYGFRARYTLLSEMLSNEGLDVVHVLTQPQYHIDTAVECLNADCELYVEKPLGLTTVDCQRLVDRSVSSKHAVGVNHQHVWNPCMTGLIDLLRGRRLGRLNHVSIIYTVPPEVVPVRDVNHYMFGAPGNFIFEFGPHPFSLIRKLIGRSLAVTGLASDPCSLPNGNVYYRSWKISAVSERGTAQLSLIVGRGNREITLLAYGQDGCVIADLKRGTLQLHENSPYPLTADFRDGLANARSLSRQALSNLWNENVVKLKIKHGGATNSFYPAFRAFYNAIRNGQPAPEDANAGHDVIEYCERAVENMQVISA
jgi:predicted dehydrogenase